jgi:hypothetical protein
MNCEISFPIGIFQNIDVYQNPSNRMMFFAAIGMPIALLVAGTVNVVASFRWLRGRWLSALACNAAAYGTMKIGMKSERGWLWIYLELTPPVARGAESKMYLAHRIFLDRIEMQENTVVSARRMGLRPVCR